MPQIATIRRTQLDLSNRLDAEHYSPRFASTLSRVRSLQPVKLRRALREPVKTGHTPSTENRRYYEPPAVKFIKTDNLREDRIDATDAQMLSEAGNARIGGSELMQDDVIVTIIGATERIIGRAARFQTAIGRSNINQNVALIRSNIPAGYFSIFLNTSYGREQLIWLSRQTGQVNLNCREVEELLIPSFSPKFVDAIHRLNSDRHALLAEAESLYRRAELGLLAALNLNGWTPRQTLSFVRQYSEGVAAVRLDAEYFHPKFREMFERIPVSVRLENLRRLVQFTKGIEVGADAYRDSGVPFWRVSNLSRYGLDSENASFIEQGLYTKLKDTYEPKQGELLLSKDATPGLAFYLHRQVDGVISSGILRLRFIADIAPHYLELVLNSLVVQFQIEQASGGSVIKHWKLPQVRTTLIPRLPGNAEVELADLVKSSHEARDKAQAMLEKGKKAIVTAIERDETVAFQLLQ